MKDQSKERIKSCMFENTFACRLSYMLYNTVF
jgi:hypothetical protein